jgi:5-methyltetrahydropteroyltriglutamate--homocysteine methyltransferase
MDYAVAVNEEIRDLFAAGADVVQIDEPYIQARPAEARAWGLSAQTAALRCGPWSKARNWFVLN